MKAIKNLIITIILLLSIYCIFAYQNEIIEFIMVKIIYKDEILDKEANKYYKDIDYEYIQLTDNYRPNNRQDILNLFYTALDKGYDELIFYCPTTYEDCVEEVNKIATEETTLSYINNFVATYNSYTKIYVNINNFGRVNITINKIYDDEDISKIDNKIDELYNSLIKDEMTDEEKIRAIHDYIILNTSYDQEQANIVKNNVLTGDENAISSNTAIGPLFTGKAICGGYTDLMALFLDKMGIKNIKIASDTHIWNAVYLDGEWKHLDLTWDDPVVINGDDTLTYNYFLISTKELKEKNDEKHNFNEEIFSELKN